MKMKAPEDTCSVSVAGQALEIDENGEVEVTTEAIAEELKAHGFTKVEQQAIKARRRSDDPTPPAPAPSSRKRVKSEGAK